MIRFCLAALPCSPPPSAPAAQVNHARPRRKVAALRDEALQGRLRLGHHRRADDRGRPAPGGTEAEARARDWSVAKLKAMGFANVRVDTFDMPVWVRGAEARGDRRPLPAEPGRRRARQQRPRPARRESPARSSASTASMRSAPRRDAGARQDRVRRPTPCRADPGRSGYGQFGAPRRQGPSIASRKGAIGDRHPLDRHRLPPQPAHRRDELRRRRGRSRRRAVDPRRRAARSASSSAAKPVRMRLVLESREHRPPAVGQCHRRSAGPRSPLRRSWSAAISTAGTSAPARSTTPPGSRSPPPPPSGSWTPGRPLRTIRIVWFGAEEVGLFGGLDYRATVRQAAAPCA